MWQISVVIDGTLVHDIHMIEGWDIRAVTTPITPPRMLVAHLRLNETQGQHWDYAGLMVLALRHVAERQAQLQLEPLSHLTDAEQQALRTWLISRSWPAWARADHALRTQLGVSDAPISLAAAARQALIPLQTLTKAAAEERLPTIRAGDRHLIYPSTIDEARSRQVLHQRPGRPKR